MTKNVFIFFKMWFHDHKEAQEKAALQMFREF